MISCFNSSASGDNLIFELTAPDYTEPGRLRSKSASIAEEKAAGRPKLWRSILTDNWAGRKFPVRKEVLYNLMPPAAEDVANDLDKALKKTAVNAVYPSQSTVESAFFDNYRRLRNISRSRFLRVTGSPSAKTLCWIRVLYNEVPFIANGSAIFADQNTLHTVNIRGRY
ncbi:MAG: hypothetical protein JW864_02150 [Spirochaetes bacterium]|nr:hypothetical protein [Spirochaetota bacterium]